MNQAAQNVSEMPGRQVRGRRDSEGTEKVVNTKPLKERVKELGDLKAKVELARQKLNDAIKAVAEKSGLQSNAVRKLVNARGEKFEDAKRDAEQTLLVFEEVGND